MATAASAIPRSPLTVLEYSMLPMKTDSMRDAADRAFITAFLLLGDAEEAEAAVLKSIGSMNAADASGEELVQEAVIAAIESDRLTQRDPNDPELASKMLPLELQRALELPHSLRQCFVLRVLMGLPREVCARLLSLEGRQVDRVASSAMSELAAIQMKRTRPV